MPTVISTRIPGLNKIISGKVRDVYDLGDRLLIVATDRISAFDVILPTPIPDKGKVLTKISQFWFDRLAYVIDHHVVSCDLDTMLKAVVDAGGTVDADLPAQLDGRSMLVARAQALPIECVARGYISGSLWKSYKECFAHGGEVIVNGQRLPVGLRESDKLPNPIFTPATKAMTGHDENISEGDAAEIVGNDVADEARRVTLKLYSEANEYALTRGLILADTKFEFGIRLGKLVWIDEALTPDSSRYWAGAEYQPGRAQSSFDKQFVRDYLETLDWPKTYPGPELPADIVEKTAEKYRDAFRRLTGTEL
jgi:phosphoribosylaminoimidazole-succinocarboxamide synthase